MLQYALPIFLGAFLLFQIQPIIARCILPWFGGMPAVWTTCMLFFQMLLLGGYAYAHWLASHLKPRAQALLHGAVLGVSLVVLALQIANWGSPIIPGPGWKPADADAPIARILLLLAVTVGLPYFVVATTSPLLQSWFARAKPGLSPYRLYALSNVGSLLGLLTYPVLVEPSLAMRAQAAVWTGGFVLFALGYAACAWQAARLAGTASDREAHADVVCHPEERASATKDLGSSATEALRSAQGDTTEALRSAQGDNAPPPWSDRLAWVALPALASTLLLAVTNQICQELAVIPFLWVLPLTLYLLSFIICFDNPRWYARAVYLPAMLLLLPVVAFVMTQPLDFPVRWQILAFVMMLFVGCMFCHGEVVARRPDPRHLTGFYLALSVGGAVGGLFVGLLAPVLFTRFYELYVALGGCWLLGLVTLLRWRGLLQQVRLAGVAGLVVLTVALPLMYQHQHRNEQRPPVLLASRNFYGAFRVEDRDRDTDDEVHSLIHGATIHGIQYVKNDLRYKPVSYYSPQSGVGLGITHHPRFTSPRGGAMRIGVIGLGTGNLAIYGRHGDTVRFYEINPAVKAVAEDPRYFSYMSDSPAQVEVVMGDARLSLERELRDTGSQQFDVLVLDAFSSDSIPAHLLTKEALALYLQHLRPPDGILAVHVSNRFLDLKRVAYALADHHQLGALRFSDPGGPGVYKSDWMLLTSSKAVLGDGNLLTKSKERPQARPLRLWTDDYYNLFQILK